MGRVGNIKTNDREEISFVFTNGGAEVVEELNQPITCGRRKAVKNCADESFYSHLRTCVEYDCVVESRQNYIAHILI